MLNYCLLSLHISCTVFHITKWLQTIELLTFLSNTFSFNHNYCFRQSVLSQPLKLLVMLKNEQALTDITMETTEQSSILCCVVRLCVSFLKWKGLGNCVFRDFPWLGWMVINYLRVWSGAYPHVNPVCWGQISSKDLSYTEREKDKQLAQQCSWCCSVV